MKKLEAADLYTYQLDRINEMIKILGYNASTLSRITGIDRKNITQYLKGETIPSAVKLIQIVSALDMYLSLRSKLDDEAE